MSKPTFTMTSDSIAVCVDGVVHNIRRGAPNFEGLKKALNEGRWNDVPNHLTVAKAIESWSKGDFKVTAGQVHLKDTVLPEALSRRIVVMVTKNEDPTSVLRFWERLQKNPSFRSVNQLWSFLDKQGIPLTEDGCFLAYKSIKQNYKDHHTGTIDNKVGVINKMPRNQISDDPNVACHDGFHVGAIEYARTFRSDDNQRIVICKVDPADVVCVPFDSSQQKMRVCKYEVIGHYGADLPSSVYKAESLPVDRKASEEEYWNDEGEGEDEGEEESEAKSKPERAAKPKKVEKKKNRPDKVKAKTKAKTKTKVSQGPAKKSPRTKFDRMDEDQLLDQSLEDLRRYATGVLKILGTSKIPGGKLTLVARILEVRK